MADKLLKKKARKVAPKKASAEAPKDAVLVGTYKEKQLAWIKRHGVYNYPVKDGDEFDPKAFAAIKELWLYAGVNGTRHVFEAEFVGKMTKAEFIAANPTYTKLGPSKGKEYYVFKTKFLEYGPRLENPIVVVRTADFGGRSVKVKKAIERFKADGEYAPLEHYLPSELAQVPRSQLRVCEAAVQLDLFAMTVLPTAQNDIRVIELFAGVGGFRIGLERASNRYRTIWSNQWEPATKRQDASLVYQRKFGVEGHSNEDIAKVPSKEIPTADLLVGGFPCQDYSVATTLKRSGGIQGKKGVLWWQIERILREKGYNAPKYLMLENVDRLLKSPAKQRGRDFAIILASLSDLGYCVEWRVINAADYGMPQRRRRTYIVAYREGSCLANEALAALAHPMEWLTRESAEAEACRCKPQDAGISEFNIVGSLAEITNNFNQGDSKNSPFKNAGFMVNRHVCTMDVDPVYRGAQTTLGQIVVDEARVPQEFFIDDAELEEWRYLKGPKNEERTAIDEDGNEFVYHYSEGGMAFPDPLDRPSRTIITGEGGASPSRFKHVILTPSGRYRRLIPLELERLNMFPDNHTDAASDGRRAFLMGNALVTGIVERIGKVLKERM